MKVNFFLLMFFLFLPLKLAFAQEVYVAVASNFTGPMVELKKKFETTLKTKLKVVYGSTGKLFAQITNGAPFEVFLSADTAHAEKLVMKGIAEDRTRFTYATGKVVLCSVKFPTEEKALEKYSVRFVAIPNPKLAPYGAAAKEILLKKQIWQKLQGKIIMGESAAQAYHFMKTGNADFALVSYSHLLEDKNSSTINSWAVPQDLYTPLKQDALLLNRGKNNTHAKLFLQFLRTEDAKSIIRKYGYE